MLSQRLHLARKHFACVNYSAGDFWELTVPIHLDYKGVGFSEGNRLQSSRGNVIGPAEIWAMWHILEDRYYNVVLCPDVSRDAL